MPAQLQRRLLIFVVLLTLVVGSLFAHWLLIGRFIESTDNAYVQGEITRVSSQLSARVAKVLVADNQHVKQGDLLLELESDDFRLALERARAALARDRSTPVIRTGCAGHFVGPGDFAVGEFHVFQVREVRVRRVLAVVHVVLDVDDDRVFKFGGEVVLLGTGSRGAEPLDFDLGQALAGGQRSHQQRRGLVEDLGDFYRFVHTLTGRLAGLRVTRNDHFVAEALNHDLVFMTFLIGIAH